MGSPRLAFVPGATRGAQAYPPESVETQEVPPASIGRELFLRLDTVLDTFLLKYYALIACLLRRYRA